jgi:UDP-glucose 4-epimerase
VINLGTGNGVTVRELVDAFERVIGHPINKREKPPRPGDVAGAYANANKALALLGWKAEKPIDEGIKDALRWGEIREQILEYS